MVLESFQKCAGPTVWPRPLRNMDLQKRSGNGRLWSDPQAGGCHGAMLQIQEDVDGFEKKSRGLGSDPEVDQEEGFLGRDSSDSTG